MKALLFILLLTLLKLSAFAGGPQYPAYTIPDSLRANANAVVRLEDFRVEIESLKKVREHYKMVVTILNENGEDYGSVSETYDRFKQLKNIEATLYDAMGNKIRSLKSNEISDRPAWDGFSLVLDARVKSFNFSWRQYPYTVSYEYEIIKTQTMFLPSWIAQPRYDLAVQQANFEYTVPAGYKLRYKMLNYNGQPQTSHEKSTDKYMWTLNNKPALGYEDYAVPASTVCASVHVAPSEFEVENYKGDMSDWNSLAKFNWTLKAGRDELPDAVKADVHRLADPLKTNREKINVLYDFLQKNTRYVSVQLGIGGWQPFDAKYVSQYKYGDCKALSNFMYALLKEAGIKSYYILIKAGPGATIFTDFPSDQFNHVTLCVPDNGDSVWLECTSQTKPPGYAGNFTGNRYALLVDENGGKLVRTPQYGLAQNQELSKIDATLDQEGMLKMKKSTLYTGFDQDEIFSKIHSKSRDELLKDLRSGIDLPTYDVVGFDYKVNKYASPPGVEELVDISAPGYAQVSGKRLFISPNVTNKLHLHLAKYEKRKYPIQFTYSFREVDSADINIPEGYQPESVPSDLSVETKFGKYKSNIKVLENKIRYYRVFEITQGIYPAADYNELVNYFEQIYKADHAKVVLVKKG